MEFRLSWLALGALLLATCTYGHVHKATETEMFSIPISPNMFNWTYQEFDQQYRFHASLVGKPELPSWLRYIYSGRHHKGFVFGTPPRGTESPVILEIIGLNRQDFETRRVVLELEVTRRDAGDIAARELQLKIDNLNVEDLLDQHRMDRLKEIFTSKLWPESDGQLYPTFLASAIDLGARLPLKPSEGEGVVVRLGSAQPFSSELRRLREEVAPLSRLASCPRDYKRTTVERLFRLAAFTLDWCSFKLYDTTYTESSTELTEVLDDALNKHQGSADSHASYKMFPDAPAWNAPCRSEVPSRSYLRELVLAVVVPVLLMLILVTALTAVLCFHYVGMPEEEYFFMNLFHICEEYLRRRAQKTGRVELCRYGTGDTEQTNLADNASNRSTGVSPNNSLARPYSPKSTTNLAADYNRPQPPPYMASNTNTLLRKPDTTPSTCSQSPEHNRTLEESLQLLNEANIASVNYMDDLNVRNERIIPILNDPERIIPILKDAERTIIPILKDPIIDLNDGMEDYVPVKETGYVQMKPDLTGYIAIKPDVFVNGKAAI